MQIDAAQLEKPNKVFSKFYIFIFFNVIKKSAYF